MTDKFEISEKKESIIRKNLIKININAFNTVKVITNLGNIMKVQTKEENKYRYIIANVKYYGSQKI